MLCSGGLGTHWRPQTCLTIAKAFIAIASDYIAEITNIRPSFEIETFICVMTSADEIILPFCDLDTALTGGHELNPWCGKSPHAKGHRSPWATIMEHAALEPLLYKRSYCNKKPAHSS